jgi:hypothetical protein
MTFSLPNELGRLSAALRHEPSTIATADSIDTNLGRFRSQWVTSLQVRGSALSLPVPRDQGLHPRGCELQAAFLDFQFEWRQGDDLPWRAEYQVRVEGLLAADSALFELQDHWRLDTDMYAPSRRNAGDPGANPSKEPHPLFHFQRGGHAQAEFSSANFLPGSTAAIEGEWRALLQSPGPRIPMLPLDPVLAIDFCLSQNDGLVWRRLRNRPEYISVIEGAQSRLWQPFFDKLQNPAFRRSWMGPALLV